MSRDVTKLTVRYGTAVTGNSAVRRNRATLATSVAQELNLSRNNTELTARIVCSMLQKLHTAHPQPSRGAVKQWRCSLVFGTVLVWISTGTEAKMSRSISSVIVGKWQYNISIKPWPSPYKSFPVHNSLTITSFDAVKSGYWQIHKHTTANSYYLDKQGLTSFIFVINQRIWWKSVLIQNHSQNHKN